MVSDRYHLRQSIGTGGMSEVYEAEDTVLGRTVAIKMLRPDMARDVNFRERFRREAQNSGKLNHPNIVAVFDTGEKDIDGLMVPYIVMEYVQGRTLRDIVREDGPMPVEEAARVLKPVADALQSSHEAGIIHRDIKPANIMLTNTGQVKVMDFGIARALDDSTSAMTQTSAVIGTAQYLSPEQARGKPADARSDVYALGCVMYETVTGRTPFEGETPFAVAYQHVQEEPTPPSDFITADLTERQRLGVDAVVLTAMAKHPADRYQSAWEMGDDLERLSQGQLPEAARSHVNDEDHPTTMVAPVSAQHRAPVASTRPSEDEESGSGLKWLAALLAASLVAIIGYFAWDFWDSSRQEAREREQAQHEAAKRSDMVTIPKVANRPRNEVVAELEKLGLLVTVNEEPSPDVPRGKVIRVNPAEGSELQKNSSVTLTVSSGKEVTEVPDLTGMKLDEATTALEEAGLELNTDVEQVNDEAPAGEIISQNPAGGTQLSKGSKVHITVSKGQKEVSVPDVSGMDRDRAVEMLSSMDFDVSVSSVDSELPENQVLKVVEQGQKLPKGSQVTLEVSNAMLIQAPDITHSTQQEAESALRAKGWSGSLEVGERIPTSNPIDSNKIGWASASRGDVIRKDQTIQVRFWEFDPAALLPQ